MAKKTSRVRKALKKEVNVNVPLPKNKLGEQLNKPRKLWWPKYFSDSWQEIKKVTWPNRRESLKLTFAVTVFTLIFTLITVVADFGFTELVERLFL